MVIFIVFFCLINFGLSENVPMFVWSNDKDVSFPQVLAGHSVNKNDFKRKFLTSGLSNFLLFTQNHLSLDDLILHGTTYGSNQQAFDDYSQLKNAVSRYHSSFLPNVEDPLKVIEVTKISENWNVIDFDLKSFALPIHTFSNTKKNFIIIDLTTVDKAFQRNNLVGKVLNMMEENQIKYTAFYTGKMANVPKMNIVDVLNGKSSMRQLLDNTIINDKPLYHILTDKQGFMLYLEGIIIGEENSTDFVGKIGENECANLNSSSYQTVKNCSVIVNFDNVGILTNVTLKFLFGTSNTGYWYVIKLRLSYNNGTNSNDVDVDTSGFDAIPVNYSYHCYALPPLQSIRNHTINFQHTSLSFNHLQMQVFMDDIKNFSEYSDCVGFFTTGIWMFLICAAILISILLFGINMLLSISTMDRYDDPKGKNLLIATNE